MADFNDFGGVTSLDDADELVGILANASAELKVTLQDIRKALQPILARKPANEPFLFYFTGQSIMTGRWAVGTSMTNNPNIRDWVDEGGGYAWQEPDPADPALGLPANPGMGFNRNQTGFLPWAFCNLVQQLTGRDCYMISAYYSGARVNRWDYYGPDGTCAELLTTQIAAALAAEPTLPDYPDAMIWTQGWADSDQNPFTWAEQVYDFFRYMEDANSAWATAGHGLLQKDTPKLFMEMPVTDNQVNGQFSGPRLVADLLPNAKLVSMRGLDQLDNVHITGDATNELGVRFALAWMGLYSDGSGAAPIQAIRNTTPLSEAYVLAADSDAPPTLSTGTLNFNATGAIDTVRLHFTSDDANNIPWNKMDRVHGVLRIYETATPANELYVRLLDWAVWNDNYPNTPNHAEFSVVILDDANWVRPADTTALTVGYWTSTLGSPVVTEYFDGQPGRIRVQSDLEASSLVSDVDDGAGAVGFLNTLRNTLSNSTAWIAKWVNGATEVGWDKEGYPKDTFSERSGTTQEIKTDISFPSSSGGLNHSTTAITLFGSLLLNQTISLFKTTKTADVVASDVTYGAEDALTTATTNVAGGSVNLTAGDGATTGTGGDGGNVVTTPGTGGGSAGADGFTLLNRLPVGGLLSLGGYTDATTGTTYETIPTWAAASPATLGMTASTTTGEITVQEAGIYLVFASISFSGTSNKEFTLGIFQNTVGTFSECIRKLGTSGDVGVVSLVTLINCAASDVITLRKKAEDAGNTFTLNRGQFMVARLSGPPTG